MSTKRRYRCAIYSRKSHEEGLEQDFNSLDAQREACEAYILSQAGLGWEVSKKVYEDGGISGGHLERKGLQELLEDIRAGQVDVIVVYKVDRLTRSITDFGKLVDVFDVNDVSFVSVTQAFNTTNSMGRLTLNVLLSFAQFEREVTAERIRDKIASSKQKGIWMGGRVPYGYKNVNKSLMIESDEAKNVKLMFALYLQHRNIMLVKEDLDREEMRSRKRINKHGKTTGGLAFSKSNIASILSNPVYAGKIKHKDKTYSGNHEAIITLEQWNAVQDLIAERKIEKKRHNHHKCPALLNGLLFDGDGNKLISHYAIKDGKKYHYYVSQSVKNNSQSKPSLRLPIHTIERTVIELLKQTLSKPCHLLEALDLDDVRVETTTLIIKKAKELSKKIEEDDPANNKTLLQKLILKVKVDIDQLVMILRPETLSELLGLELPINKPIKIERDVTIRRRGQEMKLVIGGLEANVENMNQVLIKLVANACLLRTELEAQNVSSIREFADQHNIDHADAKNLIPLSYLAPSIIEDLMAGRQPVDLNARRLKSLAYNLPLDWSEQRQLLGFDN
jgi:DNA invertase Pin-like site-specific DNA recombinase